MESRVQVFLAMMASALLAPAGARADGAADDVADDAAQAHAASEYSSVFEGIAGRGNLTTWALDVPKAGLYRVEWQADVYAPAPSPSLAGICAVADDPARSFFYDAVAYARKPGAGGAAASYLHQRVDGTFTAHLGAGTTLALRCTSSEHPAGEAEGNPDRMYGAALQARRVE